MGRGSGIERMGAEEAIARWLDAIIVRCRLSRFRSYVSEPATQTQTTRGFDFVALAPIKQFSGAAIPEVRKRNLTMTADA